MSDETHRNIFISSDDPFALYAAIPAYVIYVLLCGVAIWSTFRDSPSPRKWMRGPLFAMFTVLTSTFLLNIMQARMDSNSRIIVLQIALNVTTCLAGVLSDGVLAWRCFVLFGKRPWMKWLLAVLISLDFGIGSLSNIALGLHLRWDEASLTSNTHSMEVEKKVMQAQELIAVWAWLFFALNSSMTMSIIYKIFSSANRAKDLKVQCKDHYIYNTVIRAIIESAFIAWMGLLTFATASACFSNSAVRESSVVDFVAATIFPMAFTILPFIFGMSQSLIIARFGFSRLRAPSSTSRRTTHVLACEHRTPEPEEPIDSVFDLTKGRFSIEMSTTRSSTLA